MLITIFSARSDANVFRNSSEKPETVFASGVNEEDAIQRGLRSAVTQRCGQNIQSSTIENMATNAEPTQKIRRTASTGGNVKSYKVLASGGDGAGGHTVHLEVIVEECNVASQRITVKSKRPNTSTARANIKVDPKSALEKTVFLSIRYQMPVSGIDTGEVEGVITNAAKNFALTVVKAEVMQRPYDEVKAQQIRNEVSLEDLNFRRDDQNNHFAEMSARVVLYGVNAEIDGSTLNNKLPVDEDTTLYLEAGFNPKIGIAFFFNRKDKSIIVLKTEKSGLAFGKLLRGDIIEEINSQEIRSNYNPSELLNTSVSSGPVKLLVRRGPVSSIVVLR